MREKQRAEIGRSTAALTCAAALVSGVQTARRCDAECSAIVRPLELKEWAMHFTQVKAPI